MNNRARRDAAIVYKADMAFINSHRVATGHPPFQNLTLKQIIKQLFLIEKNSPHGNDPWGSRRVERSTRAARKTKLGKFAIDETVVLPANKLEGVQQEIAKVIEYEGNGMYIVEVAWPDNDFPDEGLREVHEDDMRHMPQVR